MPLGTFLGGKKGFAHTTSDIQENHVGQFEVAYVDKKKQEKQEAKIYARYSAFPVNNTVTVQIGAGFIIIIYLFLNYYKGCGLII